jgi:hypothetical protein
MNRYDIYVSMFVMVRVTTQFDGARGDYTLSLAVAEIKQKQRLICCRPWRTKSAFFDLRN